MLNVWEMGETVFSEVEGQQEGVGVFRAVSIWTVRNGLIAFGREYWLTVGGDEQPQWRQPSAQVLPLRAMTIS